jgi:hypothetical protein
MEPDRAGFGHRKTSGRVAALLAPAVSDTISRVQGRARVMAWTVNDAGRPVPARMGRGQIFTDNLRELAAFGG